jgi:aminoglycoside/choline kinase family phosphotransferase
MVAARDLLDAAGVRTPRIEDRDDKVPALLLEDLGDLLLADALARLSRDEQLKLYAEAGRFAGLITKEGTARVGRDHLLAFPTLSRAKLRSELALFSVHEIAGRRGRDERALLEAFSDLADRICDVLGAAPLVLAHRDFHARNLLVLPGPRLAVIDFQDTLLGPPLYDLASLTRDPYVEPDAGLVRAAAEAFAGAAGIQGQPTDDPLFPWVALQRMLKAIGTYAFQARVKDRARFLSSIPAAERLALGAVDELPQDFRAPARRLLLQLGFAGC